MHFDPSADRNLLAAFHAPDASGGQNISAGRWARPRHPAMQLLRAVMGLAHGHAELIRHSERAWASVTFTGSRHCITLGFDGSDAVSAGEKLIAALPEHEFNIHGQIVADATVVSVANEVLPAPRMVVEMELLLLEDR